MVDFKEQNARASKLLKELSLNIEPDTEVGKLSVSKQQMVEIAKALSTNADIIIMDEPSSALTERETQELFRIINELKNMGKGIIYISHRLEELENIVDRVTVMRDGKYIKTADFKDLSIGEIIALMVGREITEKYPHEQTERGKKSWRSRGYPPPRFRIFRSIFIPARYSALPALSARGARNSSGRCSARIK